MFKWFIACVIIAIIAGIFGFGGISEAFADIASLESYIHWKFFCNIMINHLANTNPDPSLI